MIPALVLAAGASSRMGRPKALLPAGDRTFVRRVLDTLAEGGVPEAIVIVRPGAAEVTREIALAGFGRAVVNVEPDRGQLSSLRVGLDAVDREAVDAVLVTLVDVPLVKPDTIAALIARARSSVAPILRAVHGGRHGHPVIFRRAVFAALRAADLGVGAKAVIRAHQVEDVEVDDPGVFVDVDTPDDYARLRIL
jgi:CTP:molybdopterin cytidylyltransferase MocA